MKKTLGFIIITLSILIGTPGTIKVSAAGFVPVMNYQRADYDFGTQNWDMTQDLMGKVYVGNYNGMLNFDGQRWQHHYLDNYSTVRSLLFDSEANRIYVGGSEEFGYFSPEEYSGKLSYHSLSSTLPINHDKFSEVWDIIKIGGNIIFRCDNCLFSHKDGNIQKLNIPGRISASALVGRKLYLGMEDGRLYSLKDGNLGSLKEEGATVGKKIVALVPYGDDALLACTPVNGIFLINESGTREFISNFTDLLKANQIFCATCKNGVYVFGTVTGGAFVWNANTDNLNIVNKESGLKNNTVLKARFDRNSNLWLCLDNGLAFVKLDSPCRRLIGESSFIGAGYASAVYENRLLLGTNQGLYIQPVDYLEYPQGISPKPILQGQVWSITKAPEGLFVSTDRGLYVYTENGLKKVEGLSGVFKTLPLYGYENKAIASSYDSFHLLQKMPDGWHDTGKISGGNDLTGDFLLDEYNRVWLSHWQKGIYLLPFNVAGNRFISTTVFQKDSGLPANDNNNISMFEGFPVSSTYSGFFNLYPENGSAQKNEDLSRLLKDGRKGHIKELSDGTMVLVDEAGVMLISRNQDGKYDKKEISGPGLFHEIIPGFTDVKKFSNDEILISTISGFTLVNTKAEQNLSTKPYPFVSNIYANQDSLIYKSPLSPGTNSNGKNLILPHNLNSLKFEFAYPECNFGEKTEYSTYLENYDKNWSPFSAEGSREYTKLADGNYVLHLRVKDNYSGEVLESSFGFAVDPPWFRTFWAKGLYTLLSFIVLLLLFASVRKKMVNIRQRVEKNKEKELEELRKETERDAMMKDMEIAGLKNEQLEQEIKYKSDELSATTMSLINKNEILRDIGEQISKIKKLAAEGSVTAIQKNLSRLQASIEENISKDSDWNSFNKNFDIVYGDYMKRLLKLHPDLSQSEKRLCCYIRMGLSSKEIAPLINISFRSVEMARYRLRKKINLSADASLADYLCAV